MDTIEPKSNLHTKRGDYLPHWVYEQAIYHICFRLNDSLPNSVLQGYSIERETILENVRKNSRKLTDDEIAKLQWLFSSKVDMYLDKGRGECYLKDSRVADIAASTLTHFDYSRYFLHAWSVMPNHVHIIVEPLPEFDLFKIIHSWKSFSANQINKELGLKGKLWHSDAYNHIIRTQKAYDHLIEYVWSNPERAGMKKWKYRYKREDGKGLESRARCP